MAYEAEYAGKGSDERTRLRTYRDSLGIAKDFCWPYFDDFVRWWKLWAGEIPPELEGTFSKVLLHIAWAMVDQEIPRMARGMFNTPQFFRCIAARPQFEYPATAAEKWGWFQMNRMQRIAWNIIPTLQETAIFGTGYRVYGHKYIEDRESIRVPEDYAMGMPYGWHDEELVTETGIITGEYVNVFNILPLPGGGQVNARDHEGAQCTDGVFWINYMTDSALKKAAEKEIFNKAAVSRLLKSHPDGEREDPSAEFKDQLVFSKTWSRLPMPQWMRKVRDERLNLRRRYRTVWFFEHDRWTIVGEDKEILRSAPGSINAIPIAKSTASPSLGEWFGKSLIDVAEDIILALNVNFNSRLDYLAGTLHPPTWVSELILDKLGHRQLDPHPYAVYEYPSNIEDIRKAVFHDRYPEISQQAFLEEGKLNEYMQKITGQPDLLAGIGSAAPVEGGATGITSLISEGGIRQTFRSRCVEESLIHDSIWLTFKYGGKYTTDDEKIRVEGADGWPWELVPHEAITDGYGIEIVGTRDFNLSEETFRRMMATAQVWLNNPVVENQKEAVRQFLLKAGGFEDVDKIVGNTDVPPPAMAEYMPPRLGGIPSEQNSFRSRMNRNTVQPRTGRMISAGAPIV